MSTISIIIGIAVAAIVRMAVGAYWYAPIGFGKRWMKLAGIKQADIKSKDAQIGIMGGFLTALIIAAVMMCLIYRLDITNVFRGAWIGFILWFGFVATNTLGGVLWELRPIEWFALVTSYDCITYTLMGAILAWFS